MVDALQVPSLVSALSLWWGLGREPQQLWRLRLGGDNCWPTMTQKELVPLLSFRLGHQDWPDLGFSNASKKLILHIPWGKQQGMCWLLRPLAAHTALFGSKEKQPASSWKSFTPCPPWGERIGMAWWGGELWSQGRQGPWHVTLSASVLTVSGACGSDPPAGAGVQAWGGLDAALSVSTLPWMHPCNAPVRPLLSDLALLGPCLQSFPSFTWF